MPSIMGPYQNIFVPGKSISDTILMSHELIHNVRKSKQGKDHKIVIKADMSNAYDHIRWTFFKRFLGNWVFKKDSFCLL